MKDSLKEYVQDLKECGEDICESIRMAKAARIYMDLMETYENEGVSLYFKADFISCYHMSGPAGTSEKYKEAFFALFESIHGGETVSFEDASRKLFAVDGKHNFSYITKMLHTQNPALPTYDGQIAAILELPPVGGGMIEEKIQKSEDILKEISLIYDELLADPDFAGVIKVLDEVFYKNRLSPYKKCELILSVYWDEKKKKAKQ